MFGWLNVHKPRGPTSREVVDRVAALVRPHKAGHAGTLDPLAEGVLVVAVGPATRLVPFVQRAPKRYVAEFLLGRRSDTEDVEGRVDELAGAPRPAEDQLLAALPALTGRILQRPPAYSAVKVGGERAYALARRGREAPLKPRPVVVHQLKLLAYRYPLLKLEIVCGAGTYVRSLGRDLARSLGTEAVMSALVRTAVGPFTLADALPLASLTADGVFQRLIPPDAGVGLPRIRVDARTQRLIAAGRLVRPPEAPEAAREAAAVDRQGRLLAVLVRQPSGAWKPRPNFAASRAS